MTSHANLPEAGFSPVHAGGGFGLLTLLFAGGLSGLALPPLGFWWVLLITVPVLVLQLERLPDRGWRKAFWGGLSFGFGYFAVVFHWIGYAFFVNAADIWMMPFAVGGLALFMACYWGIAAALSVVVPRAFLPRWLTAVFFIAVAEWLRGHLLTGFPWAVPGLAADGMGAVVQLASLVGMNGLTVLLLVWGALPFVMWRTWKRTRHLPFGAVVVLLLLPASELWGVWRLSATPVAYEGAAVVRLVQPNISQDDKWRGDNAGNIFATLVALSREGPDGSAVTHVIWPESSVPFLLDENALALRRISAMLMPGATLVAGTIRRSKIAGQPDPYFTSVLEINDHGLITGIYDKWRLVPGGEFLPFEAVLSRIGFRKVVALPESFTAGHGADNLTLPMIGAAGALICYEVIFPHGLVAAERPRVLINVTNDGWFGRSTGPYHHLAQARLRSIEQGLPLFRAANTGISAVIDGMGRILQRTDLETRAYLQSAVPQSLPPTPYARWGDGLVLFLAAALAVLLRATKLMDHAA
jgi:apolipoprotein N-acyltransferase